jgi:glyceraldehyde 3-phosphate dehydrogenase
MAVKVGINGFGRIGRNVFRAAHAAGADLEFVAVNDLVDTRTLAHLLSTTRSSAASRARSRRRDDHRSTATEIKVLSERDPGAPPWGDLGVDGRDRVDRLLHRRDDAAKHLDAGAKKVIISAPAKDPT